MGNRKEYLDFLTDESNKSYTIQNGNVVAITTPTPIPNAPDGWKDHQIKVSRNTFYYGLFRTFSLPLKFIKHAATIVRSRLFNHGIEDVITYTKAYLDENDGKHKLMYRGELDLTTAKNDLTSIECVSIEGGLSKLLKANESTSYEIDFVGDGICDVELETVKLAQSANYLIPYSLNNGNSAKLIHLEFLQQEAKNSFNSKSQDFAEVFNEQDINSSLNYFLKTESQTILQTEIFSKLDVTINFSKNYRSIKVFLYGFNDNSSNPIVKYEVGNVTNIPASINNSYWIHTISGVNTFNIPAQTRLYLCIKAIDNSNNDYFVDGSNGAMFQTEFLAPNDLSSFEYFFKIKYSYQKEKTTCKAIHPYELGKRLIAKMLGSNNFTFISNELQNCSIYLTSGDAIRKIENAKIKTNFRDFFASFNRNLCLGLQIINNEITIENREYFYDNSSVHYHLGNVKNVVVTPTNDLFPKKIKVGYQDLNYEDLNGKLEFNTTVEYSSPLTKSKTDFDLTAPYRADMYGITFAQINLEGKTTTDSSSDNSIFMIDIEENTQQEDQVIYLNNTQNCTANITKIDFATNVNNLFTYNVTTKEITYIGFNGNGKIELQVNVNVATACSVNILRNGLPIAQTTSFISSTNETFPNIQLNTGDKLTFELNTTTLPTVLVNIGAFISVSKASKCNLFRFVNQNSTTVTGLPYPETAFNIRLSPKRILLKHSKWFKSILYQQQAKKITYQTSPKNTISTNFNGNLIDEKLDVNIGTLDQNIFLPYYVEFETIVPDTMFSLLQGGLRSLFLFDYLGHTFKGFVVDAAQKPVDDESQTWKLILSRDNDLTKLIN